MEGLTSEVDVIFFSDTEAWPTLLSVRYTAVLVYMPSVHDKSFTTFFFTYILTESVVRASQMTSQPVSSIFSVLNYPLGLGDLQACPLPDVVFPPLLSASP